uniref:Trithorax group protein osa n=1 Tax=Strongyloides venezuelensis TaxID=75913 RepID=A0A0K0FUR5_STRVS
MNHFVNVSPSGRTISQNCFTTKSDCLDENRTNKNTTLTNKSESSYFYPSSLDPPQINEDYKQSVVNNEIYDSLRPLNDHSNGSKKAFCITLSTSAAIAEELRRVYVEHPKAISNLGIATLNFDTDLQSNLPHYENQVNSDNQFKKPLSHCTSDPSAPTQKESSLLVNLLRQPSMSHSSSVPIQQQSQTPIKQSPYGNVPPPPPTQQYQHGYPMPQQPPTSYPQASNHPPDNYSSYQVQQQRIEHANQQPIQHPPQYHQQQQNTIYQQHQTIMQPTTENNQQIRQISQMTVQSQVPGQMVKEVSQQSSPPKGKKKKQVTKKQQTVKEISSQQQLPATHLPNPSVGHRPHPPPQYHPGGGMHIDPYGNPQPHPSQYHPQQHPGGIQQQQPMMQQHPSEFYAMQQNQHTQRIQHQLRSPYNQQQYRPGIGPPQYGNIDGYAGQRQMHPPPPGNIPHMWQNVQRPQLASQHIQQPANVQDSQRQFVHQQPYMQQINAPPTNAQTHTSPQYPNPSILSGQQHPQGQPHYYMNPHQSGSEQQQIAHQQQMAQQRGPSMTPSHPQQHMIHSQHPQQISQQSQNTNLQQHLRPQILHDDNFCNTIVDDSLEEVDLDSIEPMRNLGTTPSTSSNSNLQNSHFMGQPTTHQQQQSNYLQGPSSQHTTSPSSGGGYYSSNQYINQNPMTNGPTPQQLGYPKGTSSHAMPNSFYHQQSPQTSGSVSGPSGGTISSPSPARTPATPRSQISTPIGGKGPSTISSDNGIQTKEEIERERQIASTINSVIEKAMVDTPSSCSTPSTSTPQPQVMPSTPHCTNLNGGKQQGTHHQQSYFTSPVNYSSPATMMNGSNEYHITPPSHINGSFEFDQGHVSQSMPYYNGNYSKIPMSNEVTHGMVNQPPFPSQQHVQSSTPRRKRKSDGSKEMITPGKTPTQVPHEDVFGSPQYLINQQQQSVANQIPASSTI